MFALIVFSQLFAFVGFSFWQYKKPTNQWPRPPYFNLHWWLLLLFSVGWFQLVLNVLSLMPTYTDKLCLTATNAGLVYLLYSFCNYWLHRFKHSNFYLWRYLHRLPHSPSQMETKIAFFRHPFEMFFNSLLLIFMAYMLGLSPVFICAVLAIEGVLECFHHSNIKTPNYLKWLCYLVQTPEMHLVHHEYGVHKYNYSPLAFWDFIFKTWKVAPKPNKLGFS